MRLGLLGARILVVTILAVATGLHGIARAGDPFAELSLIRPRRPTAAADFTVPQLNSQQVRLSDFKGRVVFLNFWATWCVPCREEMPSMERLYRRYRDRGLTILAVSVDRGGPATVAAFVKMLRLTYPIGLDPKMEVAERYRVLALPSSFLIDREGNVTGSAVGPRDWDSPAARAVVETLLK
jgi:cytochrome c biogenesis protein CcmG, thiol:disulfide interchange protein DsbE